MFKSLNENRFIDNMLDKEVASFPSEFKARKIREKGVIEKVTRDLFAVGAGFTGGILDSAGGTNYAGLTLIPAAVDIAEFSSLFALIQGYGLIVKKRFKETEHRFNPYGKARIRAMFRRGQRNLGIYAKDTVQSAARTTTVALAGYGLGQIVGEYFRR